MSSRLPIGMLTQLARNRTDEAARKLGDLTRTNAGASRQLELLLQYRREYGVQLRGLAREGAPASSGATTSSCRRSTPASRSSAPCSRRRRPGWNAAAASGSNSGAG